MEPILLSRQNTAKAMDLSLRKVNDLISKGILPAVKCGRRTLIPRAAIEKFARGHYFAKLSKSKDTSLNGRETEGRNIQ